MHKLVLTKPDGRQLVLYSHEPIPPDIHAPSPSSAPHAPNSHLRWHPLRGEWIAYASHRQNRTFLPPPEYNPLAVTKDPDSPTELPAGPWDVAVFENLFPTLVASAHTPPEIEVLTRPGVGACEVVVFTQDSRASLGTLPLPHLELLAEVWGDRYRELGVRDEVQYVFEFENRGVEVGVTLSHPHGQIYAYPFVPPIPARELQQQAEHLARTGRGLIEDIVADELKDGRRLLYRGRHVAAFIPVFARYSYEVWIATCRACPSIAEFDAAQRADFARALKTVLLKFDGLWSKPFPYIMSMHQAPTDGKAHPEAHFHVEFYPAYRMPGRLKYLAGSEMGAGVFTADTLPEEKAKELQAVPVSLD
ncbi:MAG: galactose-1-phosphate uridylyltransferase [Acidobacteria bacterium]|nr:MAG: galactose-1-phosphate uridylyltransferase [Acidobacteriota bacterium]RPJ83246.1 MAG: galactose-1-phosphate uridylyltransferase [Acidobacteriota bacterium]